MLSNQQNAPCKQSSAIVILEVHAELLKSALHREG